MKEESSEAVRLNKWFWAVRFYKARALAREMIGDGEVYCNRQRSKPGEIVELDAMLALHQGNGEHTVRTIGTTEQCRPASEAVILYGEAAENIEKREKVTLARKMNALTMSHPDKRPNKKECRDLVRFKHGESEQLAPEREMIMTQYDQLHHYLFGNYAVRDELVTVLGTLEQILANYTCSQPVKMVLVELLVAISLLAATLRFAGDTTIQLQGDGPLQLVVIDGNDQQQLRGVTRVQSDTADDAGLKTMVDNGYPVITVSPKEGERYQGMVDLEDDTLAVCLKDYFQRSEQLPTRLVIHTGEYEGQPMAGGMLLQVMSVQDTQTTDFEYLATLIKAIKAEEPSTLPANDVLWRLCYEEEVTVYEPQSVESKYIYSRERCAGALKILPDEEIDNILADEGETDMRYDYRGNHYILSIMDIAEIHDNASPVDPQVHQSPRPPQVQGGDVIRCPIPDFYLFTSRINSP